MEGQGWVFRGGGTSNLWTGTTSLSISYPVTPVLNDTLILAFSHEGTGWATVPAGWTLIAQDLAGVIRAELYWKRATASETTPVVITGLATRAQGFINVYSGGLLSGDIVDAVSTLAWTGTGVHSLTGDLRAPGITTTVEQTLLLTMTVSDVNESSTRMGTASALGTNPAPEDTRDLSTHFFFQRCALYSSTRGTLLVHESLEVPPGPVGAVVSDTPSTFPAGKNTVSFFVALKPEPTSSVSGTRYYLSNKFPVQPMIGPVAGEWDSGLGLGPAGSWMTHMVTWLLSKSKTDSGHAVFSIEQFGINAPGGAVNPTRDVLAYRWMTPPLDAQTIGGTFDLVLGARFSKSGLAAVTVGVTLKIHIYITVGQTPAVRHTLLDRYVDANALNTVGTNMTLASAQTLVSGACLAGDSVMVELGARVTFTGTMPTPTRVPSEYASVFWQRGATNSQAIISQFACAGVGVPDATPGGIGVPTDQASYLQFSHAFAEQTPTGPIPTNTTAASATVISSLPYTTTVDISRAPSPARRVWFKWTADVSGRILVHTFGTHFQSDLSVFTAISPWTPVPFPELLDDRARFYIVGLADLVIDAVAGTTYWISACAGPMTSLSIVRTMTAPAAGGMLTFTVTRYIPPANDDVILTSNAFLARYTKDGVLADLNGQLTGIQLFSLAIDYSGEPLRDFRDLATINTSHRLYVSQYAVNQVYVIQLAGLGLGRPKVGGGTFADCWLDVFASPWLHNGSSASSPHPGQLISKIALSEAGQLVAAHYGNGFTKLAGRITSGRPSYEDTSSTLNTASLLLVDAATPDAQSSVYPPLPPAVRSLQTPALEAGGLNSIQFAPDGRTLYYVSDGMYLPIGGQTVKRWDVVDGVQLPDFAVVPPGPGPVPGLKGLRPLPNTPTTPTGGCLVTNGAEVVLLDDTGAVVRHYAPAGALNLMPVDIDSDGATFWTMDEHSATLYHYDIATGNLLQTVATGMGGDEAFDLVIYRLDPFPPPPSVAYETCPCPSDPLTFGLTPPSTDPPTAPSSDPWTFGP